MSEQSLKAPVVFFLLGAILLIGMGCKEKKPSEASKDFSLQDPQKKNSIILKVEDSFYFNTDFEGYIRSSVGENQADLTILSLSRLYDRFVDEKILLQVVKKQGISLTPEEKKEYLAKFEQGFKPEKRETTTEESDIQPLFDKLLIEKYAFQLIGGIEVTEEEIEEYYKLNKREFFQPERVRVSQILVKKEDESIEVLNRIKDSSEEEFKKVAQAQSVAPEASKGGDMGWFEMGQLPYGMEKVIFSLKEGELSPVVESTYGYHIFRVNKRYGPEIVSLEEASKRIETILLDQKIKKALSDHLEELKKILNWSSYPQNLPFPYEKKEA